MVLGLYVCVLLHAPTCTQMKIYEDEDKARKEEIEALGAEDKVFSKFYDRLKEIREYHRKFLSNELTEVSFAIEALCSPYR